MRDTSGELSRILSPLTINGVELRNRVVRTAHGTNIGSGAIDEHLVAYHEARAKGGVGLSILEAASVHRTDTGTLRLHNESCIKGFRTLSSTVQRHGMKMFVQLGHLGHDGVPMDGGPSWSASAVKSPGYGWTAHAMTTDEISELTECFARVARWARDGGMDGVEVHAAHGYLLGQFLSPVTNLREDHYGGSFTNRARFFVEIVAAVRDAVGGDFPVGVRVGPDATDDGLDPLAVAEIVRHVDDTGLIDYVNVTHGSCRRSHKIIGAMHEPTGYELPSSEMITKVTRLPTLVTGRFRTLSEGEAVLASGVADLIGYTRATIADPDLVAKTIAGRADDVRPCIACNQGCVGGLALGKMSCAINVDVGFEALRVGAYDPVDQPLHAVVIGGGPAGLEAARVAAMRGHRVTLLEVGDRLGGALHYAAAAPYRQLHLDLVAWFERELPRLGVAVKLRSAATPAMVAALAANVVVVASGALPTVPDSLASHSDVRTITDFYDSTAPVSGQVVVVDCFGGYPAIGAVEKLALAGHPVTYVTAETMVAVRSARELVVIPALERITALGNGLELIVAHDVVGATNGAITIAPCGGGPQRRIEANTVVVVNLQPSGVTYGGIDAHIIGSGREPGNLWAAIREGNAAGRAV